MNETEGATPSVAAQEDKHLGKRRVAPVDPPVPVEVHNEEPLKVEIAEPVTPTPVMTPAGTLSLPPTTTAQEDVVTAGQRRINLIWESVQGFISICVTTTTVYVLAAMTLKNGDVSSNQLIAVSQLVVMATLILSFYFSRTNHSAIGGEGKKPAQDKYQGR